jgi:hypothetical protein
MGGRDAIPTSSVRLSSGGSVTGKTAFTETIGLPM